jgi:hypothetical protein
MTQQNQAEGCFEDQTLGSQEVVGVGAGRGGLREFDGGQDSSCDASGLLGGTGERPNSAHCGSKPSRACLRNGTFVAQKAIKMMLPPLLDCMQRRTRRRKLSGGHLKSFFVGYEGGGSVR